MNMDTVWYYLFLFAVIVVGFLVVKRTVSCLIRSIVLLVLVALLVYVYFMYFR